MIFYGPFLWNQLMINPHQTIEVHFSVSFYLNWIELNIFVSLKMVFFNVLHRGLRLNVELFACQWQAWQSQSRHPGHCDTVSLPSMITMSSIVSHRLSFVWFKCSFAQTSLKRFPITILFLYLISQLHSNHFSSQTIFDQFKPNRMSIEFHFLFWKNFQFFPPFLIHKILAHSFVLCIPVSPQNVHVCNVLHCNHNILYLVWSPSSGSLCLCLVLMPCKGCSFKSKWWLTADADADDDLVDAIQCLFIWAINLIWFKIIHFNSWKNIHFILKTLFFIFKAVKNLNVKC